MFSLVESLRSAILSIMAHRFRSFLTTLGIIIGVGSVIAVVSLIQGLSYSISEKFQGLGSNSLSVYAYTPFKDQLQGKRAKLSDEDFQTIKRRVRGIKRITPRFSVAGDFGGTVHYQGRSSFAKVIATTRFFQDVGQFFPQVGRFITADDNRRRRRVVVIGTALRDDLNLPDNPSGHYLQFAGEWFRIIGMLEKQGDMFGLTRDNLMIMPYNTGRSVIGNGARPDVRFQFTVANPADNAEIKAQVKRLLRQAHHLKPGVRDDFKIDTPEQLMSTFSSIIDTLTMVLGGIVSISLLVGGIGIMNIMLVSVTERTREIGICKAIGAKRHHILMQFLIEAVVLSLLGGIIGIVLGYAVGALIALVVPNFPPAQVPLWAIGIAFGFSVGVGVVFGILPAAKAANLSPIDALRYE